MFFNGSNHEFTLKNKATSNVKIYQVFTSIELGKIDIYLEDRPFSCFVGIVGLLKSKGTH